MTTKEKKYRPTATFIVISGELGQGGSVREVFTTQAKATIFVSGMLQPGWKAVDTNEQSFHTVARWEKDGDWIEIQKWKVR